MSRVRLLIFLAGCALAAIGQAQARELKVMISGGFAAAYEDLAPRYERASGNTLVTIRGPSMGNDPTAIPSRLAHGEPADVVILVRSALDNLAARHLVEADTSRDLGVGIIAAAVRSGAPKPNLSTVASLKKALLDAKSVAYSDSASGVYLSTELFPRLGVADALAKKGTMIQATPVGLKVASGDYELGFQQLSELKPIRGIDIVGPLPTSIQQYTIFSAAVVTASNDQAAACSFISFLASSLARQAIQTSGMLLPQTPNTQNKSVGCGRAGVGRVN